MTVVMVNYSLEPTAFQDHRIRHYIYCSCSYTEWLCMSQYVVPEWLIQGDKKVYVHLMSTKQKVTSNVQIVPCQSPDIYWHAELRSRRPCSVQHCPHSECVLWWPSSNNRVGIARIHLVRCTDTLWLPCNIVAYLIMGDPGMKTTSRAWWIFWFTWEYFKLLAPELFLFNFSTPCI
jgi:hypothetical protein